MSIIDGEDFTRTDTITRKILGERADGNIVALVNCALKAGMDAGLIVLLPQELGEFPHVSDMTHAEYRLFDPDYFGGTEKDRAGNYLLYKLRIMDWPDNIDDHEISDAVAATDQDGISIEDWEKAARQELELQAEEERGSSMTDDNVISLEERERRRIDKHSKMQGLPSWGGTARNA